MELVLPSPTPKPYRGIFRKHGITLWQLAAIFDSPQNRLDAPRVSRMLNGTIPTPADLDAGFATLASVLEGELTVQETPTEAATTQGEINS